MVFVVSWATSLLYSLSSFFGLTAPPVYDAIVVGAGAGGCPLAETLAQGGLNVLLVERGTATLPPSVANSKDFWDAFQSECTEVLRDVNGMALPVGNCLGGATTINLGLYGEETPAWIVEHMGEGFGSEAEILEAFEWVRERVASPTAEKAGSLLERYIQEAIKTFENPGGFVVGSVNASGSPTFEEGKIWRTYSIFDSLTGERRSANTILNLNRKNLSLLANTEVTEILFDGDLGVPFPRMSDTPRARCIRTAARGLFDPGQIICVREGGRIYVTAGTIFSAALLLKSGVGPGMRNVDNKEVGENLSDKPLVTLPGNFKKGVDDAGQFSNGNIAASGKFITSEGKEMAVLLEEFSYGIPGLFKLLNILRNNIPVFARNYISTDLAFWVVQLCQDQVGNANPFFLCRGILAQLENGCDRTTGISATVSSPTSKGRVSFDLLGSLQIDVGYLSTNEDLETLGYAVRSTFQQLKVRPDPVAFQRPCDDPKDKVCLDQSCPDINAELINFSKVVLGILNPPTANAIPRAPASFISPNFMEQFITSTDDNLELGKLLSEWITSTYHFCGTNGVGAVVDEDLKVIGAEGLYIADASVIPRTTRVNPMATILMVGRRAGIKFLQERLR